MQGECTVSLHELQVTVSRHGFEDAVERLARAWVGLLPYTTQAGRHALVTAIELRLEGLSDESPQGDLDLLGGSFSGRGRP